MKKLIKYVLFFVFVPILFMTKETKASTGSTVFIGEPIVLNSYENVEITLNDVEINEETSEIKNTHLFTNISNKIITKKASIKLEDSYSKLTINSLKILVNGLEIKEIAKEGDTYSFSFQIPPNEGKKIEITYKTDNDLQNAKIIKYTMDSIKGKEVKLYKINVKLSKYDIPLVQKIWPGAYEFENNIVSTEYFDFKVNNLTSNFIIQKETYKNIKYGDYSETYTDEDLYIINNIKDLIDNGVILEHKRDYEYNVYSRSKRKLNLEDKNGYHKFYNGVANALYEYIKGIQLIKENKQYYKNEYYAEKWTNLDRVKGYCLINYIFGKSDSEALRYFYEDMKVYRATGKRVAINYHETEQGKTINMYKNLDNSSHNVDSNNGYVIRKEWDILRTCKDDIEAIYGYNAIYVNSDIDGNKIDITEEEIIDFVNMMNVDMYLRIVIYDKRNEDDCVEAGYYTDNSKQIASRYVMEKETIEEYEKLLSEAVNNTELYEIRVKLLEDAKKRARNSYRKFSNDLVANNSKVPTIAECIAGLDEENGKYYIRAVSSIYGNIYSAIECEEAKNMLVSNKLYNDKIKKDFEDKIKNTKVSTDTEEYKNIIEHNNTEKNNKNSEFTEENNKDNNIMELIAKYKIYIIIALILLIFFIILISLIKKGGKNNGKK